MPTRSKSIDLWYWWSIKVDDDTEEATDDDVVVGDEDGIVCCDVAEVGDIETAAAAAFSISSNSLLKIDNKQPMR